MKISATTFRHGAARALAVGGLAALLLAAAPAQAQEKAQDKFDASERQAIEQIVRDYLLQNPEVLRDAMIALEMKQTAERANRLKTALSERTEQIFNSPHDFVAGNPDGDVTLVEFFDYNCGFCRRALSDMNALLKSDPNLRVVLKEFPVLSQGSLEAAQIAVAAIGQGKYMELHQALLSSRGQVDGARALQAAKDLGLDVDRLKADAARPEVREVIASSMQLADQLGISGTPSYVLGDEVIPGAIGQDEIARKIAAVREQSVKAAN